MGRWTFARCLLVLFAWSALAQTQAPAPPFIEPAEHQHGKVSLRRLAVPARLDVTGRWTTLASLMPINPVHVALMRTGNVVIVSGSGNDPANHVLTAGVLNPSLGTVHTFTIGWDMFCNGMVVLPDGRPFVLGGTIQYDPFRGEPRTAFFEPSDSTFADGLGMGNGRWYPTGTVLGNGTVMVISGAGTNGDLNTAVQVYDPGTNRFTPAGGTFASLPLYPRQHVLPNGKVFESGANADTKLWDPVSHVWTNVATTKFGKARDYGTSVLLPLTPQNNYKPAVMILGGGPRAQNVTASTERIDLSAAAPAWTFGPNMVAPRVQLNATLLPNGKVLVSGGSSNDEQAASAVLKAELYDPASNTFSSAESMEFPRLYHSNTLLLPDATVLAVGGNPERGVYEPHIEIYSPPYLYKAGGALALRPVISSVNGRILYGDTFTVYTPYPADIGSVVLIRAGAATHAFDMEQRMVSLTYAPGTGALTVTAPASGNLAPPGWYLLFVLDKTGVPSIGKLVRVG
jgi:hypothetical protein